MHHAEPEIRELAAAPAAVTRALEPDPSRRVTEIYVPLSASPAPTPL